MSKYGPNGGKKIPASTIIEGFRRLPEKKRAEILRSNLSNGALYKVGELEFASHLADLKQKDTQTIRSFLTDSKNFGGPWQDLIPLGENIAGHHLDSIYSTFKVSREPGSEADKLYALVMCKDLANRLRVFWDGVKGNKRNEYIDNGLADIKSKDNITRFMVTRFMGDPRNYAPGKSFDSFADDVIKAADLKNEKSVMEHLNDGVSGDDPRREEKLTRAAQLCMIKSEAETDPESIAAGLRGNNRQNSVDPRKALEEENEKTGMRHDMVGRMKTAVEEIPETEEEKAIFQNAALQNCRDIKRMVPADHRNEPEFRELVKYSEELSCDIVKRELRDKSVQELREKLCAEYDTLEKEKSGWFLTKKNTREHDSMTRDVRLFNAKLDILNGVEPKGLTAEEFKTVNETETEKLFSNAKRSCYSYGCLKTSNGTDRILHDAGIERFDSSMKTLLHLNELGVKLRLCEPAAAVRDEAQREILQHRRDMDWLAQNVEDLAAKTVYAQILLNRGVSEAEQKRLLEENSLQAEADKLKANKSFRDMFRTLGHKGVADAMIKGVGSLASAYHKAHAASTVNDAEPAPTTLDPADLKPRESTAGLTVPVKK